LCGRRSARSRSSLLLYSGNRVETSVSHSPGLTSEALQQPGREYRTAAFSAALRKHCLTCFLRGFKIVLSHFKQFMEESKSLNIFSIQKFYGLYGALLNSYELSLVGK